MRGVAWRAAQNRRGEQRTCQWSCPIPKPSDRTQKVGLTSPCSAWQWAPGLELPPTPYLFSLTSLAAWVLNLPCVLWGRGERPCRGVCQLRGTRGWMPTGSGNRLDRAWSWRQLTLLRACCLQSMLETNQRGELGRSSSPVLCLNPLNLGCLPA